VYGLPKQTVADFESTLRAALALHPHRVACYSYAHVPGVRHNQRLIDAASLPWRYDKFRLFQMAVETFTGSGYRWIGLDHFAQEEDELARAATEGRLRRDFMGYTARTSPHLLAFGMSAIGDVAGRFTQNVSADGAVPARAGRGETPGRARTPPERRRQGSPGRHSPADVQPRSASSPASAAGGRERCPLAAAGRRRIDH
jgi:oxygen-independent coproporphyrinogen-3 oxidase